MKYIMIEDEMYDEIYNFYILNHIIMKSKLLIYNYDNGIGYISEKYNNHVFIQQRNTASVIRNMYSIDNENKVLI